MSEAMDVSDNPAPLITVRCLQGWKGSVSVAASGVLVDFLHALCAAASLHDGDVLSMIVRGKRCDPSANLQAPLASLGVVDGAAVMLVVRSPEQRTAIAAQEERTRKLLEVERAAEALSGRVGLDPTSDDYALSITNQDGKELELDPTDRKGLALGALLHAKGSALLARYAPAVLEKLSAADGSAAAASADSSSGGSGGSLEDALHVLEAAESAFSLVQPKYLNIADNFALVLLDCVWAALLMYLKDGNGASSGSMTAASRRTAAGRLDRAKASLHQLHGEGLQRLLGRENAGQQRAVYVRLHTLQGALAFIDDETSDALSLLHKAEALRAELTITDEDDEKIAALLALGLSNHSARASLLACGKDVQRAAAHGLELAAAERARAERRIREKAMSKYGKTAKGALVDDSALQTLLSLGYEEAVAAESLRRSENVTEEAINVLCDPVAHEGIQMAIMAKNAKPAAAAATSSNTVVVDEVQLNTLCEMGFEADKARTALLQANNDLARAVDALSKGEVAAAPAPPPAPPPAAPEPPPQPKMSEEEHRAIEGAELREAVRGQEQAYAEAANLKEEGVVIGWLLKQMASKRG